MAAAVANIAPRKRKFVAPSPDEQQSCELPKKKKSPLWNKPQNFYAPPSVSSMTKEELAEWRKEERRKRNRESAAASRNKTRARIEVLEGEVADWKARYADMEAKMRCMERHIQFLTRLNSQQSSTSDAHAPHMPPPPIRQVVSHPNSPPGSPVPTVGAAPVVDLVPQAVSSSDVPSTVSYSSNANPSPALFPALLSEAKDAVPPVETEASVAAPKPAAPEAAVVYASDEDSKGRHLSISRQA